MVHYEELVKLVLKDKKCVNVVAFYVLVVAVMHRKHNTDIAKDRDENFQVSVSRRIVAIVVKWMEEIFRVMYRGKLEERGIDIFSSFYHRNSSTFSRKRNCYRLN